MKEKGAKMAPQAAALMAEYLGTDLSKISNELENNSAFSDRFKDLFALIKISILKT